MNSTGNLLNVVTSKLNISSTVISKSNGIDADEISDKLWIYIAPFLFVVAMLGNTITFLVMRRPSFRNQSTSVFLQCLAVADTCFVVVGLLPEWLEIASIIHIKALHQSICKIYKFLFYVTGDVAIWILVAFTTHRCYSVCRPLQERAAGTINKIKWIILVIIVVSCLKSVPQFWARGIEYKLGKDGEWKFKTHCGYPSDAARRYVWFIRPYVVLVTVSLIPLVIITICNILIIKSLKTRAKFSRTCSVSSRAKKEEQARRQTTVMCLTVSCLFMVCMTPSLILLIGKPFWFGRDGYTIAKAVNNLLVYVNHSFNFIMYCLSAKRFRQEFIKMVRGEKETKKVIGGGSTTAVETSSSPNVDPKEKRTLLKTDEGKELSITQVADNGMLEQPTDLKVEAVEQSDEKEDSPLTKP